MWAKTPPPANQFRIITHNVLVTVIGARAHKTFRLQLNSADYKQSLEYDRKEWHMGWSPSGPYGTFVTGPLCYLN